MKRHLRPLLRWIERLTEGLYPSGVRDPYRDRTTPAQYRDRVRRQEEHTRAVLRRRGVYQTDSKL